MVGETSSVRSSQDELLRRAAAVLRSRYRCGGSYAGLPPAAAAGLSHTLDVVGAGVGRTEGIDRDEAIALAHRLVDDDHPELSPMWPRPT